MFDATEKQVYEEVCKWWGRGDHVSHAWVACAMWSPPPPIVVDTVAFAAAAAASFADTGAAFAVVAFASSLVSSSIREYAAASAGAVGARAGASAGAGATATTRA